MFEIIFSNTVIVFGISLATGLSTVLGNGLVIFSETSNPCVLSFGSALAGGVMMYVSLTEIFNEFSEAFVQVYDKDKAFAAVTLAFLVDMGSIALTDRIVPNPYETPDPHDPAFQKNKCRHITRVGMMTAFAVTAYNLPEGLATFFATLENPAVGMPLTPAIAIHDIPEGISIIALAYFATCNRKKTVLICPASGPVEPLGAVLGYTMFKPSSSSFVFGAVFGVIAGVMVFLALDELLSVAKRYSDGHETVYDLTLGVTVIALSSVLSHF